MWRFLTITTNNVAVIGNLILNLKVESEAELQVELELAVYTISLLMAAGAYRVVTLCAQLMRDLLAITKFLVITNHISKRNSKINLS